MIHQFNVTDEIYNKLIAYSEDKLSDYNHRLAGNLENEFNLKKYSGEIQPFILEELYKIKPLMDYFKDLHLLHPKGLPLTLSDLWVNHQKKYEFNPFHNHSGVFSFIIFLKIPYTSEEQSLLSPGKKSNGDKAGKLCFYYLDQNKEGGINQLTLDVDKKWERTGLIFKSSLNHVVWPFYSDGIRITVSGNLLMDSSNA